MPSETRRHRHDAQFWAKKVRPTLACSAGQQGGPVGTVVACTASSLRRHDHKGSARLGEAGRAGTPVSRYTWAGRLGSRHSSGADSVCCEVLWTVGLTGGPTAKVATENVLPARPPICRFSVRPCKIWSMPSAAKAPPCGAGRGKAQDGGSTGGRDEGRCLGPGEGRLSSKQASKPFRVEAAQPLLCGAIREGSYSQGLQTCPQSQPDAPRCSPHAHPGLPCLCTAPRRLLSPARWPRREPAGSARRA